MASILGLYRKVLERLQVRREGGRRASRVTAHWLRRSGVTGEKVCIFVMLVRNGQLLPHSVDHAAAWSAAGYDVIVAVVTDRVNENIDVTDLGFAHSILVRRNCGYDFGAWAAVICSLGRSLHSLKTLAIANDSVLGPSTAFADMLGHADRCPADLIGILESLEHLPHFQSFVVFFRRSAIRHRAFRRFWRAVRSGDRGYVIRHYELPMRRHFELAGLQTAALLPVLPEDGANDSLSKWDTLLKRGFPYLKIELLRTNPWQASLKGWRDIAVEHGFDRTRLDRQVAALQAGAADAWAADAVPDEDDTD